MNKFNPATFKAARCLCIDLAAFLFADLDLRLQISRLQTSIIIILQPSFVQSKNHRKGADLWRIKA